MIGKEIVKSIHERSILSAMFFNARQDKKYIDNFCPDAFKSHYIAKLGKDASRYFRKRKEFANYQDKKTLKADAFFNGVLERRTKKCLKKRSLKTAR